MSVYDFMECVECGKPSPANDGGWIPGWGCLHGSLAVCSRACAEKYHVEKCRKDIPIDLEFPEGESTDSMQIVLVLLSRWPG